MELSSETQQYMILIATVLSVLNSVLQAVKHKRLVSTCCSRKMEFGIDVRDVPASPKDVEVHNSASVAKDKRVSPPDLESL